MELRLVGCMVYQPLLGYFMTKSDCLLLQGIMWFILTHDNYLYTIITGGACGVMVIIVENGHDDTSSNSGQGWLHFT